MKAIAIFALVSGLFLTTPARADSTFLPKKAGECGTSESGFIKDVLDAESASKAERAVRVLELYMIRNPLLRFLGSLTSEDRAILEGFTTGKVPFKLVEGVARQRLEPIARNFNLTYCNLGDSVAKSIRLFPRCESKDGKRYYAKVRSIRIVAGASPKKPLLGITSCLEEGPLYGCLHVNLLDGSDDYKELAAQTEAATRRINATTRIKPAKCPDPKKSPDSGPEPKHVPSDGGVPDAGSPAGDARETDATVQPAR